MAAPATTAAEREKERLAHSVLYKESTSEIKDDIVSLLDCWKGGGLGKSNPTLGRTEAGFLLWYHALNAKETQQEMYDNGAVATSIAVLDADNARTASITDTERTIAAALLRLLAEEEEYRDKFLSAKSTLGNGFEVLSDALGNLAVGQERVAGVLRLLVEGQRCRNRIINNCSPINWRHFLGLLSDPLSHNEKAKVELAFFVRYLAMGRDDLKAEAASAGGARALLAMLRSCKRESALNAAAGCLMRLAEEPTFLRTVAEAGGIKLLSDMVSPPPHFFVLSAVENSKRRGEQAVRRELELAEQREQLKAAVKFREEQLQAQRQREAKEREKELKRDHGPAARTKAISSSVPASTILPRLGSSNAPPGKPGKAKLGARRGTHLSTHQAPNLPPVEEAKSSVEMPQIDVRYLPVQHVRPPVPDADELHPHDVGTSSLRIGWERHLSVQTRGYACTILYNLSLEDRYCVVIDSCGLTFRLCKFLCTILAPPPPPKGKKGAKEKKGKKGKAAKVKLTPEEENAVVAICGCLRHLTTLSDTNKARIVKYGAVPPLVQLYQQSTRNKIRWNCRGVLNAVGCLSENGKALDATGVFPEEFLVYEPMHLRKPDLTVLQAEFRAEDMAAQVKDQMDAAAAAAGVAEVAAA
eukprot:jgi/Tetstr1/465228/TSEL_009933.t1